MEASGTGPRHPSLTPYAGVAMSGRMRCSVEGCDRSPDMVVAGRLLCVVHAARYRCSVEGCDCWADAVLAGRLLCRHHLAEYRQTGRSPRDRQQPR